MVLYYPLCAGGDLYLLDAWHIPQFLQLQRHPPAASSSALCYAAYSVLARVLTQDFQSSELSYIMMFVSFICFNVLSLTQHLFYRYAQGICCTFDPGRLPGFHPVLRGPFLSGDLSADQLCFIESRSLKNERFLEI